MSHHTGHGSEVTRRAVVAGTGLLAASAALAACSSYGNSAGSAPEAPLADQPAAPADQPAAPGDRSGASAGQPLGSTGDIPVGGGAVFASQEVVVTQPEPGTFKAFSATCTHQGCTVNKVASGTIDCPCHGSKFAIADGSVVDGPASRPLAQRQIEVAGDTIQLL
ncbi:MAG: Rieske (2Fe-2S) protein [Actinomycetota bacterium]|nr:Rieske (2Fe-2S) protein [Actinomycetota bacterium]